MPHDATRALWAGSVPANPDTWTDPGKEPAWGCAPMPHPGAGLQFAHQAVQRHWLKIAVC
jgi:hypothetical protein